MTSEKKPKTSVIKSKEKLDFIGNLLQKSSVLFLVSFVFLFILCVQGNAKENHFSEFLSCASIFPNWLLKQIFELAWPPSIANIFCLSFNLSFLVFACCRLGILIYFVKKFVRFIFLVWKNHGKAHWQNQNEIGKDVIKRISSVVNDLCTHKAKYLAKTRTVIICLGSASWLLYAIFRNSSINTYICDFINGVIYLFCQQDNWVNVKFLTEISLWGGLFTVFFLILIELILVSGWDYFRFGKSGFYKGGKHWYEEEKKYLVEGDFSFSGKLLFNVLHFPQNVIVKIIIILVWVLFIPPLFLLTLPIVFVGWLFKKPYNWLSGLTKKVSAKKRSFKIGSKQIDVRPFKWLHPLVEWVFKDLFEVRLKTVEDYKKLVLDNIYQAYILFRYNSLGSRLVYWVILVFVGLNIKCLLDGNVPTWSYWWTNNSWIGNFIRSSTVLKTYLCNPLDNLSFLLLFGLIVEKGARKAFIKSFLYERINMFIVVMSTVVAVLLVLSNVAEKGFVASLLFFDALFTVIFLIEIGIKIYEAGQKFFFKENVECKLTWSNLDKWNILDASVVLASITSFFMLKDEYQLLSGMYAMIILRIIRLLKLVRLLRLFKKYLANLWEGAKHAMIKSIPIIIVFAILMFFMGFGLYWASDHLNIGRVYFKDPITSVVSLFQLFTYDGWTKIPNDVAGQFVERFRDEGYWWIDTAVRIGFCALVFAGGIVGVALLNSVFVDGMMLRDKSEADQVRRLNDLSKKIEEISTKLDDIEKRRLQG
ncbi:MAG: ion transporter [Fibrobacter sp.]|nr:ion transporter [Fibrobacter sp.]